MTETARVRARPGVRVPIEGTRRQIDEQTAVTVPLTNYYRRQLQCGDLVRVETP